MSATTMSNRCQENGRRIAEAARPGVDSDAGTQRQPETAGPSTHLRVIATWLAIYPIVAVGASLIRVFLPELPPWAATWILTGIAIPIGVYVGVPKATLPVVTAAWRRVRKSLSGLRHRVAGGAAS